MNEMDKLKDYMKTLASQEGSNLKKERQKKSWWKRLFSRKKGKSK